MNKKGDFLEDAVKIVFAIALTGLILYLGWQMLAALLADSDIKDTKRNFENLVGEVNIVLDNNEVFSHGKDTLSIMNEWAVVGFDTNPRTAYAEGEDAPIHPPEECGDSACLCLFDFEIRNTRNPDDPDKAEMCEIFEGNIKFVGSISQLPDPTGPLEGLRGRLKAVNINNGLPAEATLPEEQLIIYGSRFSSIREFYIEKRAEGATTYITIAPSTEATKLRPKYLVPCSEFSDEECRGKYADDFILELFKACVLNEENNRCELRNARKCSRGEIETPCVCGDKLYVNGYCSGPLETDFYSPINCFDPEDEVNDCNDYCRYSCTTEQSQACSRDYCNIGPCNYVPYTGGTVHTFCQRAS